MSLPATRNIVAYAGDTYQHEFEFVDEDDAAMDLSARTFAAQWRPRRSSPNSQAVSFTVDDSDAATGIVTITLSAAQMAALDPTGVYDLQSTVAGVVETLVPGPFTTTLDVTRS